MNLLADAAEKASVAAAWMGGRAYPQQRINDAWMLELAGHFHDTAAGTATPRAYQFAWNDDVIVSNQFAGVFTDASEAIASGLNTQVSGIPIVVFNPLNIAREDVVEARCGVSGWYAQGGPGCRSRRKGSSRRSLRTARFFLWRRLRRLDIRSTGCFPHEAAKEHSALKVTDSSLENDRYRVQLNAQGDVSSIYDKELEKGAAIGSNSARNLNRYAEDLPCVEYGV